MTSPTVSVPQFSHTEGEITLLPQEFDVLSILNEATDLTHGSEELLEKTYTPAQRFHLSPERANFLHAFDDVLHGEVLVLGPGTGALARFLAEKGCRVHAVEPSQAGAALTRARCRNLDVTAYVGGAELFPSHTSYDAIVVTGPPARPGASLEEYIERLKTSLKTRGILLVAVGNKLANPSPIDEWSVTKAALETALHGAGFSDIRFAYGFPGYEAARLIIQPELTESYPPGLENILAAYESAASRAGREPFWRSILENDLLPYFSNAFLVLASNHPLPAAKDGEVFRIYASHRRKHFARFTRFASEGHNLTVCRMPLFPGVAAPPESPYVSRSSTEPYWKGESYLRRLQHILSQENWRPEEISQWAKPWLDLLYDKASEETFHSYIGGFQRMLVLPTAYIDCIPSNIVAGPDGALIPFDFEYEALAPIPLKFAAFRGFFYSFSSVVFAGSPESEPTRIVDLILHVMQLSRIDLTDAELQNYIETEASLQNIIAAASRDAVETGIRSAVLTLQRSTPQESESSSRPAVVVELFWKKQEAHYSTWNSQSATFTAGKNRQIVTLSIPASVDPIHSLRLDPCNRVGTFYLFSLRLFNSAGQCVWVWNGDRSQLARAQKDLSFADVPTGGPGVLLLSESGDPNFELSVSPDVLRDLQSGGRLDVDMAWPESEDALLLCRRILDTKGYRDRISSLEAENRARAAEQNEANAKHEADLRLIQEERERAAAEYANLEAGFHKANQRLARASSEILKAEQARDGISVLNRELQEQLRTVKDYLRTVSLERDSLQQQAEVILEMQAQIDRLTMQLSRLEQDPSSNTGRETAPTPVPEKAGPADRFEPRQRPEEIARLQRQVEQLMAQNEHLERLVMGIFEGRIWRTLGALGSPIKMLFGSGRK